MRPILLQLLLRKSLCILLLALIGSVPAFAQPANDDCSAATALTSNATCNTNYTVNNATPSTGFPAGCAAAGVHNDVWFRFVAVSSTHTVTINSLGSNFTSSEIQLYRGTCAALVSVDCGTTTFTSTGLVIGTTYYVRVSKLGAAISNNGAFRICVTHPGTPPTNDECAGAVTLTSNTSCNNTQYDLRYAAVSAGIPVGCAIAGLHYDVWFKFVAAATSETVTVGSMGASITSPELQMFSGTCGALTSLSCGTNTVTGTGLAIGNTYFVRFSNVGTMPTTAGGGLFSLCLTHPNPPPVNDDCAGATTLTSAATCTPTTGTLHYATSNGPAGSCGTGVNASNTYDVFYRFQAVSSRQAISISNLGSNLTAASTYIQVLSGTCGTFSNVICQAASVTGGRVNLSGLTVGTFYYVRVYVLLSPTASTSTTWNFNICVENPPVNDDCSGAVTLTPGATCTNTAGTLDLATPQTISTGCLTGSQYDVWYRFTATTTTHTITLSNLGANFTSPRIQLFTTSCAGASVGCSVVGSSSLTQAGLAIGTTYYIRVASGTDPSGAGTVADFNICVTTAAVPPSNNTCAGAITLTSNTTCTNISGTLINATATGGLPACGNAASPDVWFKFVAQTAYPVITLSSVGANLTTAGPRIQVFSGFCGTLTTVGTCSTSPYTPPGAGLTPGATYYVRITTTNLSATVTTGTYTFNICVTDPIGAAIDYGKSYINLTDGTIGGSIDVGDILEIRATLVIARPGNTGAHKAIDSIAYFDTLRAGAGFRMMPNSMAVRTNEGKLFRPSNSTYFTDAYDVADAAWITTAGAGSDTALQMNLGLNATYAAKGRLRSNSKPSNFGGTCIIMATYRVQVNAAYGTTITYGGGAFRYRDSLTGVFHEVIFPEQKLFVYSSPGACPDATSPLNVIGDEFNGTFGAPSASAGSQNRGTSANTDYLYKPFNPAGPDDYYYAIANNTSANASAVQTVAKPNAARVFNQWDITGDHTGAANTTKGNLPCNMSQPISPTNPCGYMLIINSAYKTDVAFKFNVNGACEETYYEISGWFKNICYKCGCDSNGVASGSAGYIPTATGDSSGVRPNIAFQIDGIDYYTTGDLVYQGLGGTQTGSDTLNKWVRRSFVFQTRPGQKDFTVTFRNNAPGGGGNDWALDDIGIRTCYPKMIYSPSNTPSVCVGKTLTITDTVRSYYNVYIHYQWQRSTDAGISWVNIPGATGVASTVWNGSEYEYRNSYTLPPSASKLTNNGDLYRMVVATTAANLISGCNYSDVTPITISVVNSCIDIDDDDDGIPDYVEFNDPLALMDHNSNGIPNWKDPLYPGFVDNNSDGVNDNFDYGADSNDDGIPNYLDPTFPGFIDINGDGVNDNADKDLDGIINQYDLDSDNDGIPDVVESYGVDTNGDGVIDNYTDTDNDGFSQNVDANSTGVAGSGNGLGAQDLDGDGIPNYLDLDSDNDGIPDIIEAGGIDANNDGMVDNFADSDADGLNDSVDGDVGNDGFAEFASNGLLRTGPDTSPVDGRADNYPYKNMDYDKRANPYDLDSDGDGIVDVIEAGFTDANFDGFVDGPRGPDGWNIALNNLATLVLRNTDARGNPDYLDIDADDDGIPDNIEGQTTAGYKFPSYTDTDNDGIDNAYDLAPYASVFGGSGIFVADKDGDGIPDYRDLDTDSDGVPDIIEGNDFNLNGFSDDNVTLTYLDTDGDGLDNRFDSLNSVTNIKGTSFMMGTNGSVIGDPNPGTRAPVQKTNPSQPERDWRYVLFVLPLDLLEFSGTLSGNSTALSWDIISPLYLDHFEVERSIDNANYTLINTMDASIAINERKNFVMQDNVKDIKADVFFYRLKIIAKNGQFRYSDVVAVRKETSKGVITVFPNPARNNSTISFYAESNGVAVISLKDYTGKEVLNITHKVIKGNNSVLLTGLSRFSNGLYNVQVFIGQEVITQKLSIYR